MSRKFLALLPLLWVPLGCSRTDDAAKNKAHDAGDTKASEQVAPSASPSVGIITKGALCASWPKSVPVYPGATIVACGEVAAGDGGTSDIVAALARRQTRDAGTTPEMAAMLSLGIQTTAKSDDIVAFYKKQLSRYDTTSQSIFGEMGTTTFVNKKDSADPVSFVMLMPMDEASGKTSSTILVMLKKM